MLREFAAPAIAGQLAGPVVDDPGDMTEAILARLTGEYNKAGQKFSKQLGGGPFELQAAWKKKELRAKARLMANGLHKTMAVALDRIERLPAAEQAAARKKLLAYKLEQLEGMIASEGQFQAQVDIVAHSGLADVAKAKVMNFLPGWAHPCDICTAIHHGNPYTIRQATALGAKAHPSCKCNWETGWQVDHDLIASTKRQVRDGERTLWTGSRQTPAAGPAAKRTALMQERGGGWKGKRAEQKRVVTLRAKAEGRAAAGAATAAFG